MNLVEVLTSRLENAEKLSLRCSVEQGKRLISALEDYAFATRQFEKSHEKLWEIALGDPKRSERIWSIRQAGSAETMLSMHAYYQGALDKLYEAQNWLYQIAGPKYCQVITKEISDLLRDIKFSAFGAYELSVIDTPRPRVSALLKHKEEHKRLWDLRQDALYKMIQILKKAAYIENSEAQAETQQKAKPVEEPKEQKQGRPRKYTDEDLERMLSAYEQCYQETNDSKAAWNKVADLYGAKSGDAVRVACIKHQKKLKKST